ncbi:MAG: hypothetical protein IJB84_01635 [Lachnospiraceae bacterium]|nr:hypothetical protein [Lachnospiraceae bacterium]
MSNKETNQPVQEKVMTKYDLKMQRRKEEKERQLKEKRKDTITGIVLVVALALLVISFPIRNLLAINGKYIELNEQPITKVEYDYHYYTAKSNFMNTYGYTFMYMGMDVNTIDSQAYTEERTFKDYFDEMAVDNLTRIKALAADAQAAGFVYEDLEEDYADYLANVETSAANAGMNKKAFLQSMYGPYANEERVKAYVMEEIYVNEYYKEVGETKKPTEEEVEAYYEENKDTYDSVDYYLYTAEAVLPTAAPDSEQATQPTEEEVAAAMELAKADAEAAVEEIKEKGELNENKTQAQIFEVLREWLFDEAREAGDTTVIEDESSNRYYAVAFENRYLDKTPSANVRLVITANGDGQAIYDEWAAGAATEESFIELCNKYNDPAIISNKDGYFEGLVSTSVPEEVKEWVFDSARTAGDATVIVPEGENYQYVAYYIEPNKEEWILSIENTIATERMNEYIDELVAKMVVGDPKDKLKYPELIEKEEAAAAASSETASAEASVESSQAAE